MKEVMRDNKSFLSCLGHEILINIIVDIYFLKVIKYKFG